MVVETFLSRLRRRTYRGRWRGRCGLHEKVNHQRLSCARGIHPAYWSRHPAPGLQWPLCGLPAPRGGGEAGEAGATGAGASGDLARRRRVHPRRRRVSHRGHLDDGAERCYRRDRSGYWPARTGVQQAGGAPDRVAWLPSSAPDRSHRVRAPDGYRRGSHHHWIACVSPGCRTEASKRVVARRPAVGTCSRGYGPPSGDHHCGRLAAPRRWGGGCAPTRSQAICPTRSGRRPTASPGAISLRGCAQVRTGICM